MTDLRNTPTKALIAELTGRYPHMADVLEVVATVPPDSFQTSDHWDNHLWAIDHASKRLPEIYDRADGEYRDNFPNVADLVGGPF